MLSPFDQVIDRRGIPNLNKWKWYPEDVLPLWLADMDFRTPEPILEALRRSLEHGVLGYERADAALLELVAERMQRLYGWQVEPDMVLPIPGVNIGNRVAAGVVCQPGDGVLVQPPVFYDILDLPARYGLHRLDAPLALVDHAPTLHYELELPGFRRAIDGAGSHATLFLLCNPHNPVGKIFRREELESMAAACQAQGVVICSDEIHQELVLGDAQFTPVASISPEVAQRTITLVGAGKAFNVSGLGCAFAIIPDEELRRRYAAELERGSLDPGSMGLAAARAAYSGACDAWLTELRAYLTANRDFVVQFLREELPALQMTLPEATYLAWIDCRAVVAQGRIPGKPQEFFLEKARVGLYDGEAFGPGGEGFVRLNFACPRAILEAALERIKRSLVA